MLVLYSKSQFVSSIFITRNALYQEAERNRSDIKDI
jgi:hypothetical protein